MLVVLSFLPFNFTLYNFGKLCTGFFVTIWMAAVMFKSNDILRKQTALKVGTELLFLLQNLRVLLSPCFYSDRNLTKYHKKFIRTLLSDEWYKDNVFQWTTLIFSFIYSVSTLIYIKKEREPTVGLGVENVELYSNPFIGAVVISWISIKIASTGDYLISCIMLTRSRLVTFNFIYLRAQKVRWNLYLK